MQKFLPALILMIVCAIVCGLLAVANAMTKEKIAQAQVEKVQKSLVSVFGEDTYTPAETAYEGVSAVYTSKSGVTVFDITTSGYSKDGIQALIGIQADGTVAGIGIVSLKETAGLGTKIADAAYLSQYQGISDVQEGPDAITGATFSSGGLQAAVELALTTYQMMQEVESHGGTDQLS